MDGMMNGGGTSGWVVFAWIAVVLIIGVAAVVGGVWSARVLAQGRGNRGFDGTVPRAVGSDPAQLILRRRYADGQITREEYLQGKVDLE